MKDVKIFSSAPQQAGAVVGARRLPIFRVKAKPVEYVEDLQSLWVWILLRARHGTCVRIGASARRITSTTRSAIGHRITMPPIARRTARLTRKPRAVVADIGLDSRTQTTFGTCGR